MAAWLETERTVELSSEILPISRVGLHGLESPPCRNERMTSGTLKSMPSINAQFDVRQRIGGQ
jgi:hypothetical protein